MDHIRPLLPLPLKEDLFVIPHASFYINSEGFSLRNNPLASASATLFRKYFTLALTSVAWLLHLHLHHAHVHDLGHLTCTFACGACFKVASLSS